MDVTINVEPYVAVAFAAAFAMCFIALMVLKYRR